MYNQKSSPLTPFFRHCLRAGAQVYTLPTNDCGRDATLLSLDEPLEADGHPAYGSWKHVAVLSTKAFHQAPNAGAGCHQSLAQSEQWQRPAQDDQ